MPFSMFTDGLCFITETTLNLDSSHELKKHQKPGGYINIYQPI